MANNNNNAPRPKVNADPDAFYSGQIEDNSGPSITAAIRYEEGTGDLILRIPAASLVHSNSRPTSKASRRMFAVKGDIDDKQVGLPGYVEYNGKNWGVKFSNPQFNMFYSPDRG